MNRIKRDLMAQLQNDAMIEGSFVRTEDTKDSMVPQSSNGAHIRVKRYRHSFSNYPQISYRGCKFGTCIVHNLANQIYQYTLTRTRTAQHQPEKSAPRAMAAERRSVPERRLLLPVVDGKIQPWWISTRSTKGKTQQPLDINVASMQQESSILKTKDKLFQTLLRT
ncbi:unnamed protein product [Staurois parvus]|uniref:Pro-adrenomedullin n=1 Tax=Staurois parvus TaxID=386267 RepID=A0ABN9DNG7_9NEOB|nr:unnamed protein product [Staurois parvus]